eukprot:2784715-Alexandrium_andersonii.AAC.1
MRGIDAASPGIAWLAWIPVKGRPRWGAHLVGFDRASIETAGARLKQLRDEHGQHFLQANRAH